MRKRNLHQNLECMLVYNILIFHSTNSTDHSDSEISPVPPQNTNRQTNVTQGMITFKEECHMTQSLWKVTPVLLFPSCTGHWDGPREIMRAGGGRDRSV